MLDGHERGSRDLTADGEALDEAEGDEEDRPRVVAVLGRRQQSDADGGDADEDEADDEDRLASDLVAEVPEDDAADGSDEVADGEGGERGEESTLRAQGREEEGSEDEAGRRRVEHEVVVLEHRAEEPGGEYGAHFPGIRSGACLGAGAGTGSGVGTGYGIDGLGHNSSLNRAAGTALCRLVAVGFRARSSTERRCGSDRRCG
ncbi:hypothetical protein K4X33_04090 [Brevibacterium casei]|nr:hypothetical protein K4X33_04090 [Brevibacterium casei]